jgi:hypothetical protein
VVEDDTRRGMVEPSLTAVSGYLVEARNQEAERWWCMYRPAAEKGEKDVTAVP